MTEPDCKSLLGDYYYNITWKPNERVEKTLARSIVSAIRDDIVENSMVDEWDEKEKRKRM